MEEKTASAFNRLLIPQRSKSMSAVRLLVLAAKVLPPASIKRLAWAVSHFALQGIVTLVHGGVWRSSARHC
jgi:hypothetical protein